MGIINETKELYQKIKHDKIFFIIFRTLVVLFVISIVIALITYFDDVSDHQRATSVTQLKKSVRELTQHKSSIPKDTARKKEAEYDLK